MPETSGAKVIPQHLSAQHVVPSAPATVADRAECQKCGAGKYSTLSIIDGLCMECAELSSITLPQPKVQP
jgi:hypothetical protein